MKNNSKHALDETQIKAIEAIWYVFKNSNYKSSMSNEEINSALKIKNVKVEGHASEMAEFLFAIYAELIDTGIIQISIKTGLVDFADINLTREGRKIINKYTDYISYINALEREKRNEKLRKIATFIIALTALIISLINLIINWYQIK